MAVLTAEAGLPDWVTARGKNRGKGGGRMKERERKEERRR